MEHTEQMKPLVIYHKHCMDGFTALWAAQKALGDVEAWGANHRQKPPSNVSGRDVYIVDFAYSRAELIQMNEQANSLVVLDHHKTNEKDLEGLDFCVFDMDRSGAGITWDYFFPATPRPWLVDYVETQDIWTWSLPDDREICAFLNLQEQTIERWDELSAMNREEIVEKGKIVAQTTSDYVTRTASLAREMILCGHHVPIVNAPFWASSELGNYLAKSLMEDGSFPAFSVVWHVKRNGQYKFSLRSVENPETGVAFDVTPICEKFNGGGHHSAGGFVVPKLPFK